ncbi:MAG: phage portal protein [Phycisphaerales bacterium]
MTDALTRIQQAAADHERNALDRYARLWSYYRNPMRNVRENGESRGRWYRLAQEAGLPARLLGRIDERGRANGREIVVENDIAWRLHSMVDFLFGKGFIVTAERAEGEKRARVESALSEIFESSGGGAMWQDAALLAHVFGHVDFALVADESTGVKVEMIDPRRGVPLVSAEDYRRLDAYAVHLVSGSTSPASDQWARRTRVIRSDGWMLFEDWREVGGEPTPWTAGRVPVVHVQNTAQPLSFEGLGEVEPLIPLQDELNTRLSDRASRVTLQSFKMYLAKGLGGAGRGEVGPGQLWWTENSEAAIDEFGGDAASPSEDRHIDEIRDAMDKTSGVPPLASGIVQAKIGNLSSANALRVTLMGLLSKTARKQAAYGRAIVELCEMILTALDQQGRLATRPEERRVRVKWPDPLPPDVRERVYAAEAKVRLGAPRERVLVELWDI